MSISFGLWCNSSDQLHATKGPSFRATVTAHKLCCFTSTKFTIHDHVFKLPKAKDHVILARATKLVLRLQDPHDYRGMYKLSGARYCGLRATVLEEIKTKIKHLCQQILTIYYIVLAYDVDFNILNVVYRKSHIY